MERWAKFGYGSGAFRWRCENTVGNHDEVTDSKFTVLGCTIGNKRHAILGDAEGIQGKGVHGTMFSNEFSGIHILNITGNRTWQGYIGGQAGLMTTVQFARAESVAGLEG